MGITVTHQPRWENLQSIDGTTEQLEVETANGETVWVAPELDDTQSDEPYIVLSIKDPDGYDGPTGKDQYGESYAFAISILSVKEAAAIATALARAVQVIEREQGGR